MSPGQRLVRGQYPRAPSSPLDFTLVAGGRSNLTFRVTDAAGQPTPCAGRRSSHVLPTAHDMGREHRIIAALGPTGVPVPPALGFCDDADVNGAPFYVMGYVDGHRAAHAGGGRADLRPRPPGAGPASPSSTPWPASTRSTSTPSDSATWAGRRATSPASSSAGTASTASRKAMGGPDVADIDEVHDLLAERIPDAGRHRHRPRRLPPGQLHRRRRRRWSGRPRLGALHPRRPPRRRRPADGLLGRARRRDHRLDGAGDDRPRLPRPGPSCATATPGRPGRDLADLDFYVAFGYWKLACILEGVYARYAGGARGGDQSGLPRLRRPGRSALAASAAKIAGRLDGGGPTRRRVGPEPAVVRVRQLAERARRHRSSSSASRAGSTPASAASPPPTRCSADDADRGAGHLRHRPAARPAGPPADLRIDNGVNIGLTWPEITLRVGGQPLRAQPARARRAGAGPALAPVHLRGGGPRPPARRRDGHRPRRLPGAGAPHPPGAPVGHRHHARAGPGVGFLPATIDVPPASTPAWSAASPKPGWPPSASGPRSRTTRRPCPTRRPAPPCSTSWPRWAGSSIDSTALHTAGGPDLHPDRTAHRQQRRAPGHGPPARAPARPGAGYGHPRPAPVGRRDLAAELERFLRGEQQ